MSAVVASAARAIGRVRSLAELVLAVVVAAFVGAVLAKLGNTDDQLKIAVAGMGAVGIVAAALHPAFGLAVLLAVLPFDYPITIGGFLTGTTQLIVVGMAIVLTPRIRLARIPSSARLGGLALVAGGLVAALGAQDTDIAIWGAVRWVCILALAYAAFSVLDESHRPMDRLMTILAVAAPIVALGAIAQRLGIFAFVGTPYVAELPDSFFGYYTNFAGFCAFAGLLLMGEVLRCVGEGQGTRATWVGASLTLVLLGMAASASRGGVLSLGAGLVVLLALSTNRGGLAFRVVGVLLVLGAAVYFSTPDTTRTTLVQRFDQPFGTSNSDRARFALQEAGRKALIEEPMGLGYRNFTAYAEEAVRSRYVNQAFQHAHQTPLMMGVEGGWIGLAGWLTIALTPLGLAVRAYAAGRLTPRGMGIAAAASGLLAQGVFDYLYYEIAFPVVLVVLLWAAWWEFGRRPA